MSKRVGTRKIGTITVQTEVICPNCGNKTPSTEKMCQNCGAPRKVKYTHSEVTETGKVLTGKDLARAKEGADTCPACGSLDWKHDREENNGVCTQCNYNLGEKSDYQLGGGTEPELEALPKKKDVGYIRTYGNQTNESFVKPWMYLLGASLVILCVFLTWALTTTHEVRGRVEVVEWQITAHQEELQLKSGEGWNPPAQATITSKTEEFYDWQPNQIGETHGEYYVLSTPEQIGHTHGEDIPVETPGAIYTSEPYICSGPTMEDGGSVTYDWCVDEFQEDSTWGYEESPETPVYAPQVNVLQTTQPTPVYGTPTPIFKIYYYYTFWEWTNIGNLNPTFGYDNFPYPPSGQVDDYHRVVEDSHHYKVVIRFDNGEEKIYEGSDPQILNDYMLGEYVTGHFNIFGGLNSIEPYIPE